MGSWTTVWSESPSAGSIVQPTSDAAEPPVYPIEDFHPNLFGPLTIQPEGAFTTSRLDAARPRNVHHCHVQRTVIL